MATAEKVSEWCGEEPEGCVLDLAIDGLRDAGFEVEELRADTDGEAQELLRTTITDQDDPQPVIVILQNPLLATRMNHAVVVISIEPGKAVSDMQWDVEFMDPLTGRIERDTNGMFWRQWDFAGQRALIIRP